MKLKRILSIMLSLAVLLSMVPMASAAGEDGSIDECKHVCETVITATTCTEKYYTAHTHSFASTVTEPSCTNAGYTTYSCSCGESYKDDYTSALGHKWDEGKVTVEPTEEAEGEKTYTCTLCGKTRSESIASVEHSHSYSEAVTAPSCTEKGYTTYTCSCGESYVDNYTDALGHKWDEGKVTKEPTESAEGEKTYICTLCSETRIEAVPALGHSHSYSEAVTAPSCTEKGYTTYTCACGESYKDKYTDALGHKWDKGELSKEPTTEAEGEKTYTCADCGEKMTEKIDKLEPDCGGKHSWDKGKVTKEPTNKAEGEKTYTCTRCGETKTEKLDKLPGADAFKDVSKEHYFYKAVDWAVGGNITNGISATRFGPDVACTRAQVLTFLWRAAGEPAPRSEENPFTDLKKGEYYYDAVLWAVEQGITSGVSATRFGPGVVCTRAQVLTFLWRAAGEPAPESRENPFADVKESDYFYDAVLWSMESGITTGMDEDTFAPGADCIRAQIVTFLYRAFNAELR